MDLEKKELLFKIIKAILMVRDYMRKILRTLGATAFTVDRVKNLAQVLVDSPSVDKIKNHEALLMYTELYIVKLVKNIP